MSSNLVMIFLYNVIKHVMCRGKVGEEYLKMYDYLLILSIYIYMLSIVGQIAEPIWLKTLRGKRGYPGGDTNTQS